MSRTHKDAPGARKARRDRRYAERPFDYTPGPGFVPGPDVPVLRAAWHDQLGVVPAAAIRAATADDPHGYSWDEYATAAMELPELGPVLARAELTVIANGF